MRQGDPLSPYLFLMVLEIFAIHVRENKCIKGIVVEDEEIKLCAFADDLTTFLRDVSSYKNLVESLNRFEQCSGLKVNSDKTEALSLRVQDPNNSIVELGISKIEIPIKILDTNLREFQFKILHRILTTNYSLYKMSLIPSPVCSFCDNNDESLRHLFVHCSFVSTFWDQILNWNPICRDNFDNLDDNAILFGIPSTGQME